METKSETDRAEDGVQPRDASNVNSNYNRDPTVDIKTHRVKSAVYWSSSSSFSSCMGFNQIVSLNNNTT